MNIHEHIDSILLLNRPTAQTTSLVHSKVDCNSHFVNLPRSELIDRLMLILNSAAAVLLVLFLKLRNSPIFYMFSYLIGPY